MDIRLPFERLLAHDHWANGKALASLEAMADPPAKARELLAHVLGAEVAWIERMTKGRDPADWESWETLDLPAVRKAWSGEVTARWAEFLRDPERASAQRKFTYVNYLGETWDARVEDALIQLMLHSAYHRGQIASRVRAGGGEPAVVDFIRAVRGGDVA